MKTETSSAPVINCESTCPCGQSKFRVSGRLLTRFICHCRICQALYQAPSADITAYKASSVVPLSPETLSYKRYRLPPNVNRATCKHCSRPVLGFMQMAPFFRFGFVPAINLEGATPLPAPAMHIFYHRRVADAADQLPKYSGYWTSEAVATVKMLQHWAS